MERQIVYGATAAVTVLTAAAEYIRPVEASPEPAARGAMLQLTSAQLAQVRGGCPIRVVIKNDWFRDRGGVTDSRGRPLFQEGIDELAGAAEGVRFTVSADGQSVNLVTSRGIATADFLLPRGNTTVDGREGVRFNLTDQVLQETTVHSVGCGFEKAINIRSALNPQQPPTIQNPPVTSPSVGQPPARRDGEVDPRLQDWLSWTGEKLSGAERFFFENRETGLIIVLIIGGFILVPRTLAGLWRLIRGH